MDKLFVTDKKDTWIEKDCLNGEWPENVECLYTRIQVDVALDQLAEAVCRDFGSRFPVVLGVMIGALPTLGYLLPRLAFKLEVDYVHATRYQGEREGGSLIWKHFPERPLAGRSVLIVDDILDRGITLAGIVDYCREQGAADIRIAVLAQKILPEPAVIAADYCALTVPDRYVFGYGLDADHLWRNAPGIFAFINNADSTGSVS